MKNWIVELICDILLLALILIMPIGYLMNVYALTQCDFKEPYKAEIIRGIGIVAAPVGIIVGYIDIKD